MSLRVQFIGAGDAFGSGGRLQTCIMLDGDGRRVLIDCGTSSLIGLRRIGIDPNSIDTILLTHLHGDHFGGVPFFVLDAHFARRTGALTIAGPPDAKARIDALSEILYPGMTGIDLRFPLQVVEYTAETANPIAGLTVTPFHAVHTEAANPHALRVECAGRTVTYTGDGAWGDSLIDAARGADLLIAECNFHDREVPLHMSYRTLKSHMDELGAKRVVLTHMADDMLALAADLDEECAEDGLVVDIP